MAVTHILRAGVLLALFAVVGVGLVAFVHDHTQARIAANERAYLLRELNEVLPESAYDNDILSDTASLDDPALGPGPATAYRAWKAGEPAAVVFMVTAPDGYSGAIKMLVGIHYDGTLAGVRVISHHETPGLGDRIDTRHGDWVLGFQGRSLGDPPPARWAVKRDGGDFDQFTGATITPRAVVKAVKRALVYFSERRDALFATTPAPQGNRAPQVIGQVET
jgi:electron transport complex protein RnfG